MPLLELLGKVFFIPETITNFSNGILLFLLGVSAAMIWNLRDKNKALHSAIQGKTEIIKHLELENKKSVNLVYELSSFKRLEDKANNQIKNLHLILENTPKNYLHYERFSKSLEEWEDFGIAVFKAKKEFLLKSGIPEMIDTSNSTENVLIQEVMSMEPADIHPLEDYLKYTPTEHIFWAASSRHQRRKLKAIFKRQEDLHPAAKSDKLRRAIIQAYNRSKKSIFKVGQKKFDGLVSKLLSGNDDFDYVDEDDEIICCICLDEVERDMTALKCNHKFHNSCITKWLEEHDKCPTCRAPQKEIIVRTWEYWTANFA